MAAMRRGVVRGFLPICALCPKAEPLAPRSYAIASQAADDGVGDDTEPKPSTTLFVTGLNKRTTSGALHKAFSKFGTVHQVRVARDSASGFSKGYGFVTYSNLEDAARGMKEMDAEELDGWLIFVEYARPYIPRRRREKDSALERKGLPSIFDYFCPLRFSDDRCPSLQKSN